MSEIEKRFKNARAVLRGRGTVTMLLIFGDQVVIGWKTCTEIWRS